MITDEQVRAAIVVLNAYTAAEVELDNDLLDELETAIEKAFNARYEDAENYTDDEIICDMSLPDDDLLPFAPTF